MIFPVVIVAVLIVVLVKLPVVAVIVGTVTKVENVPVDALRVPVSVRFVKPVRFVTAKFVIFAVPIDVFVDVNVFIVPVLLYNDDEFAMSHVI